MKREKINEFIRKNHDLSRAQLAEKCGISIGAVAIREHRMGFKREWKLETANKDPVLAHKEREAKSGERSQLKNTARRVVELEKTLEEAFKIKRTPQTFVIKKSKGVGSQAVAFMVASDWHIEEEVRGNTVDWKNEYNLKISEARAQNFFANGVRLLKLFQKDTEIKKLVLPLLGDFFTNSLRDENLENNLLLPGDALWRVKCYLVSGIKYILANTNVEIFCPTHVGNHSRVTDKVHISTEAGNSLEQYMYRNLAEYFENEKRVKFSISEGSMSYLDVYDKTVRFIHGHQIRYAGGVGGLTIPIRKALAQWQKVRRADFTVMGHWHSTLDGGDFLVNGSLIGWNAFAQFIKADYEEPKQTFFLIHNHNGGTKTGVCPIWL